MIYEIIENAVEPSYCNFLYTRLVNEGAPFKMAAIDEVSSKHTPDDDIRSDTGLLFQCYMQDENDPIAHPVFKAYSEYIIESYFTKSAFAYDSAIIRRIFYNYYNTSSSGIFHQDHEEENHISLIMTLNDCDGGTYIDDTFIPSKQGTIIAFDSRTQHRGVGPIKTRYRYAVNVVFTYEKMEKHELT